MNVRVLAAGMRVAEVPSHEFSRIYGVSNLRTFRDGYRVLRTIVRERAHVRGRGTAWAPRQRLSGGSPLIEARGAAAAPKRALRATIARSRS
jgi:hypothetical protein